MPLARMAMYGLDLGEVTRSKFDFDVVGHYARPDVFQLIVDEEPKPPVTNDPDLARAVGIKSPISSVENRT